MNWLMHFDKPSSLTNDSEEVRVFEGLAFSALTGLLVYLTALFAWIA